MYNSKPQDVTDWSTSKQYQPLSENQKTERTREHNRAVSQNITHGEIKEIGIAKNIILGEIAEQLYVISQREDNWDGYGSKSPNNLSLDNARRLMNEFVDAIVSEGEVSLTPSLISSDEDGHITVEWHEEGRQLHLQIEEEEVDYIQVWGPNIDTEMYVDTFHSKDYLTLWKWLIYGKK